MLGLVTSYVSPEIIDFASQSSRQACWSVCTSIYNSMWAFVGVCGRFLPTPKELVRLRSLTDLA